MTEIPEALRITMEKYAINLSQMELDPSVIEKRLTVANAKASLENAQKELEAAEESFRELEKELEASIKIQVLEIGTSASHEGVTAKYRKAYVSETYPVADVRKILLANPAILPAFKAISNVKEFDATVSVSYKAPENEYTGAD